MQSKQSHHLTSIRPLTAILMCFVSIVWSNVLSSSEVSLLDGTKVTAELTSFTDTHIQIDGRENPIPWAEIDQIIFQPEGNSVEAQGEDQLLALLKDGSYIPIDSLTGIKNGLQVESAYGSLAVPLGVLVSWGNQDWIESKRNETNDIIRLDGSEISGSVQGITDGNILLKSDLAPDAIPLPLTGVQGVHLAIPVDRPRGIYLTTQATQDSPPVILVPTQAGFVLQSLPKQQIPSKLINQITVHGGRRVFLSDLSPSLVNEEGAFGVVWNYSTNKNIDGSPLFLGGKRHRSGLVVHSKAELEWTLNKDYTVFSAEVGIVDLMGREGDCSVRILGDGSLLWEKSSARGGDKPESIALDVDGVTTLRLEVGYGARYDIGDHLGLGNAWFLKK